MTDKDRKSIEADMVNMHEAAYHGQKESYITDLQVSHDLIVKEIFNEYGQYPYFSACLAFLAGISVGKRLERSRQLNR